MQAGIDPDRDLVRHAFSGAHDATAKWAESGEVDAGALDEPVWDKLVEEQEGRHEQGGLRGSAGSGDHGPAAD